MGFEAWNRESSAAFWKQWRTGKRWSENGTGSIGPRPLCFLHPHPYIHKELKQMLWPEKKVAELGGPPHSLSLLHCSLLFLFRSLRAAVIGRYCSHAAKPRIFSLFPSPNCKLVSPHISPRRALGHWGITILVCVAGIEQGRDVLENILVKVEQAIVD